MLQIMDLEGEGERGGERESGGRGGHGLGVAKEMCLLDMERVDIGSPLRRQVCVGEYVCMCVLASMSNTFTSLELLSFYR